MNRRINEFIATGMYTGYLPVAPGTWGSWMAACMVALPSIYFEWRLYGIVNMIAVIAALAFTLIGIYTAGELARANKAKDPGYIVIDEFAGQALAFALVPVTTLSFFTAFVSFRIFDIVKPYPIKKLQDLPGGLGIVIDDVLAGLYAAITTWVVIRLAG